MDFYGRVEEQKAINYLISKSKFQGCIVYGRRRLGKTELLKHCLVGKNISCIFFQCKQENEISNTIELTSLIEKELNLSHLHFSSFSDAIKFIFTEAKKKKIYFVIDEYPYLKKFIKGIDSILQEIIDSNLDSDIKFFICGSSISTMEAILSDSNPLYRRFQLSLLIKQMDYFDSSKFYPSFSKDDKVRFYAAFGGIPYYNRQIDPSLSVEDNIINLLIGPYSHMDEEITVNLKEEISKINNANLVFSVISNGVHHYSDILEKTHINVSASLNDVLDTLLRMDLIEYIAPINAKTNRQKGYYVVSDNTIRFYYHYIHNNLSARAILDNHVFYQKYIKEDFETKFVPQVFEEISKQFLIRKNKEGKLSPLLVDIGTYWYDNPKEKKNGQFDVVGKTDNGYVFYEVKFKKNKITDKIIEEEIKQVNQTTLKPIQYGFISSNGFDLTNKYDYQFYTLDDLFMI